MLTVSVQRRISRILWKVLRNTLGEDALRKCRAPYWRDPAVICLCLLTVFKALRWQQRNCKPLGSGKIENPSEELKNVTEEFSYCRKKRGYGNRETNRKSVVRLLFFADWYGVVLWGFLWYYVFNVSIWFWGIIKNHWVKKLQPRGWNEWRSLQL